MGGGERGLDWIGDPSVIPCREGLEIPLFSLERTGLVDFGRVGHGRFHAGVCLHVQAQDERWEDRCEGEKKIMEGSTRNYEGAKRNLSRSPAQ